MKKTILSIFIVTFLPFILSAQSNLNKKLNLIKGKIDEVVIRSEGKEFKFSGDDAEKLFKNMKQNKLMKDFKFFTDDGKMILSDSLNKKIIIKNPNDSSSDDNVMIFINEQLEKDTLSSSNKKIEKKVIVTDDDGYKVVKVTTKENGQEKVEVFEGKAADEYLNNMQNDDDLNIRVNVDKDNNGKKVKKIIIEKEEDQKE